MLDEVAKWCTEVESGVRNVDSVLINMLLPEISNTILAQMVEGVKPGAIQVGIGADGTFVYS